MTLDRTWRDEAAELGLTVTPGHPDWHEGLGTEQTAEENLDSALAAMRQLGFLEVES